MAVMSTLNPRTGPTSFDVGQLATLDYSDYLVLSYGNEILSVSAHALYDGNQSGDKGAAMVNEFATAAANSGSEQDAEAAQDEERQQPSKIARSNEEAETQDEANTQYKANTQNQGDKPTIASSYSNEDAERATNPSCSEQCTSEKGDDEANSAEADATHAQDQSDDKDSAPTIVADYRVGMGNYMLEDWAKQSSSKHFETKLHEMAEAANRDLDTGEGDSQGTTHPRETGAKGGQEPLLPMSEEEAQNLKMYILYRLNELESSSDFSGMSMDRDENKKNLKKGGFMMVAHLVFIGGFSPPPWKNGPRKRKYIFTRWGLFEIKIRPYYVENWDESDMRGYYCFSHNGKGWDKLAKDIQQKRVVLIRVGAFEPQKYYPPGTTRVVNYEGEGHAYMSKSKWPVDLATPMRPARGYVHEDDVDQLIAQFKAFEDEDHHALRSAPRNVECGTGTQNQDTPSGSLSSSAAARSQGREHDQFNGRARANANGAQDYNNTPLFSSGNAMSLAQPRRVSLHDLKGHDNSNAMPLGVDRRGLFQLLPNHGPQNTASQMNATSVVGGGHVGEKRGVQEDSEQASNKRVRFESPFSSASDASGSRSPPVTSQDEDPIVTNRDTGFSIDFGKKVPGTLVDDMLEDDDGDGGEDDDGSDTNV